MPELPEVENFKLLLNEHCPSDRIAAVQAEDHSLLKGIVPGTLNRRLAGYRLLSSDRHGKILILRMEHGSALAMHFGTNGSIVYLRPGDEEPAYTRLRIDFANGEAVAYVNPRRLGGVEFLESPEAFIAKSDMGPDALDRQLNLAVFRSLLAGTKRDIKSVLMDQKVLAGIGNIYSDEILFQAGIHPSTPVEALSAAATAKLYQALGTTLGAAIRHRLDAERNADAAPANFMLPQRHKGGRCPRCGAALTSEKHGGRTSYSCPRCQVLGGRADAEPHSATRSHTRSVARRV